MKTMRRIQSFVRREGRLTPGQASALEAFGPEYLLTINPTVPLIFAQIYGNDHPVIVEIGFGMGQSLLIQAKNHADHNYLGFEVHRPGVGALLSGIAQERLPNIRAVVGDVVLALDMIPAHSLQGVQIFFPDPWHKKRHHKRRLIQTDFVQRLAEKIRPGGFLHCATDWQDYAEHMLTAINAVQCFEHAEFVSRPDTRPLTKFEQRGIRLGHGVWDIYVRNLGPVVNEHCNDD